MKFLGFLQGERRIGVAYSLKKNGQGFFATAGHGWPSLVLGMAGHGQLCPAMATGLGWPTCIAPTPSTLTNVEVLDMNIHY